MADECESQVAGITFWFVKSSLTESHGEEKFGVKLELDARVNDEELWNEMLKKFQAGFRIHAAPDFHLEVIDVMRAELQALQDKNLVLARRVAQAEDAHTQTKNELDHYKKPFESLSRALRGG